jgi:hypothetical protein
MSRLEPQENFYIFIASLPSLIETEDFNQFLHRFTITSPPLITTVDLYLFRNNAPYWGDLALHYERACQLKIWKRTHYTLNGKEGDMPTLPDNLKHAHRLLLAGAVGKSFPGFNPVDKREKERWRVVTMVLVGLRNAAFEIVGVESLPVYRVDVGSMPRTSMVFGGGFGSGF